MTKRLNLLAALPLALLCACGNPATPNMQEDDVASEGPARTETATTPSAEQSGSRAELVPMALSEKDMGGGSLGGELGCAFTPSARGETLMLAAADVSDTAGAKAKMKFAPDPVVLTMDGSGGFAALSRGARFAGPDGLTVNIVRSGDEPLKEEPQVAMESPRYTALMVVGRDGRELSIDGVWECGP